MQRVRWVLVAMTAVTVLTGCANPDDAYWDAERAAMVEKLRSFYRIEEGSLLTAMARVKRHLFIPESHRRKATAYADHPSPIGFDQTISQPYVVAYMTQKLEIRPGEKVLEVGTGSGYQAAILAALGANVYTIEIIPELAAHAEAVLRQQGFTSVVVRSGDGYQGWPEQAPFDAIIVTCAPEDVPQALQDQLREGGRMIVPVGPAGATQRLVILRKQAGRVQRVDDLPVRFVPMVRGASTNGPG